MCIFWKCGFFDFDPFWSSILEHFGCIWRRFGASGRVSGSQNGAKSAPMRRPKGGPSEVWKWKSNFDEKVAISRATKGYLGTCLDKEREAR